MEFAYHRERLADNGVVQQISYPGICNLNNRINPIWRRSNFRVGHLHEEARLWKLGDVAFDEFTQPLQLSIYRRMEPGLRLATLMLEHSAPFFSRLLAGELEDPPVRRVRPLGTRAEDWRCCPAHLVGDPQYPPDILAEHLKEFSDHVAASSLFYVSPDQEGSLDWGETLPTGRECYRYMTGLGLSLTLVFCGPGWHRTKAQNRRYFNFQLAITLIHELAHTAWHTRQWGEIVKDPQAMLEDAIFFPSEEHIELGQSWEIWFFGGSLQPIDVPDDALGCLGIAYRLFTVDTGNYDSKTYPDCSSASQAVPARSINQFFQKEKWQAHSNGTAPFSIEITPLTSISGDVWDPDLDSIFRRRLEANHDSQTNPRIHFPDL